MVLPLFWHLDSLVIRLWDESRLASNAYEMYDSGDYLVTHYEGTPDMWNTKPPLLIWIQVLFMKTIGVNELAIRLPSAIAAFLTIITLLNFSLKYLKSFWFGFISIAILVTSQGYVTLHSTRTGDYDSLLTLFTTLSCIYFFTHLETKKIRALYLFATFLALGVLTKSITALLFLPGLFFFTIFTGQLKNILFNKHTYYSLILFLFIILSFYIPREIANPGYLNAVWENELGGRYMNVIEDHGQDFWFYYDNIIGYNFSFWYLLIPCGLFIGIYNKDLKIKQLTIFSSVLVLSFFLIISFAQTKLHWYDVPMYPFLSIISAVCIKYLYDYLKELNWANQTLKNNVLPFLFLFLLFIGPYQNVVDRTYKPKETSKENDSYELSYFLKGALKENRNLNNQFIVNDSYNAPLRLYVHMLNLKGANIDFKSMSDIEENDILIIQQEHVKEFLETNFNVDILSEDKNVTTYKVYGRKESN